MLAIYLVGSLVDRTFGSFVWDAEKEHLNMAKHGVDFETAAQVFLDPQRKAYADAKHSAKEQRYFCLGKIGHKVLTVRFLIRDGEIRIIGAGYWRKGERHYAQGH